MIDFRQDMIRRYKRNIESAESELKYHFSEVRRLKMIIAENNVALNSLKFCQMSINDLMKGDLN